MSFKVRYFNKSRVFNNPIKLISLLENDSDKYIAAKIDGKFVVSLNTYISKNTSVEFLTLKDSDGMEVYRSSLCYLVSMAFHRLYPKYRLHFTYSISRSLKFEIIDKYQFITPFMLVRLKQEMNKIIKSDYQIDRVPINAKDIKKLCLDYHFDDKLPLIDMVPEEYLEADKCDDYINYFNNALVPSTSYIKDFELRLMYGAVLLRYPRYENEGKIPPYEKSNVYLKALYDSEQWAKQMNVETIAKINEKITNRKDAIDFINACEARHYRQIVEIGNTIEKNLKWIHLICIAGPSSSGKTTFANRLRIDLMSRGIIPTMISLDNYYKDRKDIPLNEKGEPDFECLESLEVDLFNKHMDKLIHGEEIDSPIYSFGNKSMKKSQKLKLSKRGVIIIEGIHALNEKMTKKISRINKYKIYISPQIQVNIDHDNPLSLTDLRLLRRITRDARSRNTNPIDTIKMWDDVRSGEFKYIYKGIEGADYVFNSFSFFELCAYRKITLPLLIKISPKEKLFPIVVRLYKMLYYFKEIDINLIPNNSLVREFIGGSCFE